MARERELSEERTQERQQKTLSLRISDVLHDRLERVRECLVRKSRQSCDDLRGCQASAGVCRRRAPRIGSS